MLNSVLTLFLEQGIVNHDIKTIANLIPISERKILKLYPTKEDLVRASFELFIMKLIIPQINNHKEHIDALEAMYTGIFKFVETPNKRLYLQEIYTNFPRIFSEIIPPFYDKISVFQRHLFNLGVEQGTIRDDIDLDLCLRIYSHMLISVNISNIVCPFFDEKIVDREISMIVFYGISTMKGQKLLKGYVKKYA